MAGILARRIRAPCQAEVTVVFLETADRGLPLVDVPDGPVLGAEVDLARRVLPERGEEAARHQR